MKWASGATRAEQAFVWSLVTCVPMRNCLPDRSALAHSPRHLLSPPRVFLHSKQFRVPLDQGSLAQLDWQDEEGNAQFAI